MIIGSLTNAMNIRSLPCFHFAINPHNDNQSLPYQMMTISPRHWSLFFLLVALTASFALSADLESRLRERRGSSAYVRFGKRGAGEEEDGGQIGEVR